MGVSDIDGDTLSVMLAGASSVPDGLFATLPGVVLSGAVGAQSIVLSGGSLYADANGEWTATVLLSDAEGATPVEVGVVTVSVTPVNDAPAFTVGTTVMTIPEGQISLSSLTVATDVSDIEGDALSVTLAGASSVPDDLFATLPDVTLSGAVDVQSTVVIGLFRFTVTVTLGAVDAQSIVLSGGSLHADANGVWMGTVRLSDGVAVVDVGVVTVSVTPVNDAPATARSSDDCTQDTSTPCTISIGESVTGQISHAYDSDMWRLDLGDATTPMLIVVHVTGDDLAKKVTLYKDYYSDDRPYLKDVGSMEPYYPEQFTTSIYTDLLPYYLKSFSLVHNNLNPDKEAYSYYIKIEGINDRWAQNHDIGDYTLHLEAMPAAEDCTRCGTISVGESVTGNTFPGDVDTWHLDLGDLLDNGPLLITLYTTGGVATRGILNMEDSPIFFNSRHRSSDVNNGFRIVRNVWSSNDYQENKDYYYIQVIGDLYNFNIEDGDEYTLHLEASPAPKDDCTSGFHPSIFSPSCTMTISIGETVTGFLGNYDIDTWALDFGNITTSILITVSVTGEDIGKDLWLFERHSVDNERGNCQVCPHIGWFGLHNIGGEQDGLIAYHVASRGGWGTIRATNPSEQDIYHVASRSRWRTISDSESDNHTFIITANPGEYAYLLGMDNWVSNFHGVNAHGFYTVHLGVASTPTFLAASTPMVVSVDETDDEVTIPPFTVATEVNDIYYSTLTVMLAEGNSVPDDLFATLPNVTLSGAEGAQSIVLSGGVANANANGVWTATVLLSNDTTTLDVGVVTVLVTPVNDAPAFTIGTTVAEMTENRGPVPSLTIATDVSDIDGDTLSVTLDGVQGTEALFSHPPTVALAGFTGFQSIVLSGGFLSADANGEWTATVRLSDGVTTVETGVVTLSALHCTAGIDTPCVLTVGASMTGSIDPRSDHDWWRLDFGEETVSINVTVHTTGHFNTYGELKIKGVSAEIETKESDDDGGDGRNFSIVREYADPNKNTYYINVKSAFGWRTGTYTLHLETSPAVGTPQTYVLANTVATITEEQGPLSSPVLSLTVATGVSHKNSIPLSVTLAGVSSVPNDALNESGALFSRPPTVALAGYTGAQSIVLGGGRLHADANGVWTATVMLSDAEGAAPVEVGVVTVSVKHCTADVDTPCVLTAGEPVTGTIDPRNDHDWWRLDFGEATTTLDITVYSTGRFNTYGELNRQGAGEEINTIEQDDNSGAGRNFRIFRGYTDPNGSTYYLNVRSAFGWRKGTYTLQMETAPADINPLYFSVHVPAEILTFGVDTGRVGGSGAGGVECRPLVDSAETDSCAGVSMTAYLASGACATAEAPTYARAVSLCERLEYDGTSLTLDYGGLHNVWWAGSNAVRQTVASRVASYYVRPVLGLGDDIHLPANEAVDVTVTIRSYGEAMTDAQAGEQADNQGTIYVAMMGKGLMPRVVPRTVSGRVSMSVVFDDVLLTAGKKASVSVWWYDALTTLYTPGRTKAKLIATEDSAQVSTGEEQALFHARRIPFGLDVPAQTLTFAVDEGQVGSSGEGGVECRLPASEADHCGGVSMTAYLASGACENKPTYEQAASLCERLEYDGELLTLDYGGLHNVWWAGSNAVHQTVASRVASYYVPPVLGLGDDIYLPADETVDVTVTILSHGEAMTDAQVGEQADNQGTIYVALMSKGLMPRVVSRTVSGRVLTSVVFDDVLLTVGKKASVSVWWYDALTTLYTPGRVKAKLIATEDSAQVSADEEQALSFIREIPFSLQVPAETLTFTVDAGRVNGSGNAAVECLLPAEALVADGCAGASLSLSLTAYLASGACKNKPTYDQAASLCERLEYDGESLTLNYGGLYSVWWMGDNGVHQTVASQVASYYVPPVLSMGDDIYIPAGESVNVTLSVRSYGVIDGKVSMYITLFDGEVVQTPYLEVSGHVATNVVFTNVSLDAGEEVNGSLSVATSSLYTPGRTEVTLTATTDTAIVSADDVRAIPVLRICGKARDVIESSLTESCPNGKVAELAMSVEVQRWVGESLVTLSAYWTDDSTTPVSTIGILPSPVWWPSVWWPSMNRMSVWVTAPIASAVSVGHVLEMKVTRATEGTEETLAQERYPVVTDAAARFDQSARLSLPKIYASESQTLRLGRYGKTAAVIDLADIPSDVASASDLPSVLLEGPPDYESGFPIYDFSVHLGLGGTEASVVLQFPEGLPADFVYYKYRGGGIGWSPFIVTGTEAQYSSADYPCPRAGALVEAEGLWSSGLSAGHRCVLLVMSDGGPNDDDGERNGIVVDPGAFSYSGRDAGAIGVIGGGSGGHSGVGATTEARAYTALFALLLLAGAALLIRRAYSARPR